MREAIIVALASDTSILMDIKKIFDYYMEKIMCSQDFDISEDNKKEKDTDDDKNNYIEILNRSFNRRAAQIRAFREKTELLNCEIE